MQNREKNDKESEVNILQNKIKTRSGATSTIIVIIILITAIAMAGVYFNYW